MERKKELDNTKEKMDHLVEKLYIGREKGPRAARRDRLPPRTPPHQLRFRIARRLRSLRVAQEACGEARASSGPAPPKRAVAGRAGRAGKMDTAARALHDDMYGSRDINAPGDARPRAAATPARGVRR